MKSGEMDLIEFLDKAVEYKVGCVQMDPLWPSQGLDLTIDSLTRLGGMLNERGLEIVVKGNSGGLGTLANPPEKSQDDITFFLSKIEAADKLNSPVVRVVTRAYPFPTKHTQPPKGVLREKVVGWVIANLKALTPLAEELGIRIAVENHGDLRITELERILAEVDSPALGIQYDLLEQVAIFEDPFLAAERLLPYAYTVHWNDAYPFLSSSGFCVAACLPGKGILLLDKVFQMIASLRRKIYLFTAFQAATMESEDPLVNAYLVNLKERHRQLTV
jgi:sugar phosphate isomerase/epimerase